MFICNKDVLQNQTLLTLTTSVIKCMHNNADDTQVYIELSQSDTHKSISSLSDCLTDISLWMKSSKLKLNSDKTEFIIIGTKQHRHKLSNHFPVKLLLLLHPWLVPSSGVAGIAD